jgi:hypothetical protein
MRPQAGHRLQDGPLWRRTAMLLACCTVLAVALGVLFAHQSRVDGLDKAIDSWVVRSLSGHKSLLGWLASPATVIRAGGTSLIMVVACLVTGRLKGALLAATAVPTASALCDSLIKPLVHRSDLAYPSGHVTSILALTAMLTVLLALPPRPLIPGPARLLIPGRRGPDRLRRRHRCHRPAVAFLHRHDWRRRRRGRDGLRGGTHTRPAGSQPLAASPDHLAAIPRTSTSPEPAGQPGQPGELKERHSGLITKAPPCALLPPGRGTGPRVGPHRNWPQRNAAVITRWRA